MQSTPCFRNRFVANGRVQGVGFRPFIYRLAQEFQLTGFVQNTSAGVVIEVQGAAEGVEGFNSALQQRLPPLAQLTSLQRETLSAVTPPESSFTIVASSAGTGHQVLISPDVATCPDCLSELHDPGDPRFAYPFINCTNCGPRYTITHSIPYDRPSTSMACFPLCAQCRAEYEDPLDRRFHAQPNACPRCGPQLWMADAQGRTVETEAPVLATAAQRLADGAIVAVKGLGGFHLACLATSNAAVTTLRERKHRLGKPLAIMVPDLGVAQRVVRVTAAEQAWLTGTVRPIVVCEKHEPTPLATAIAPDTTSVGVMLPYTPLHHMLFAYLCAVLPKDAVPALVLTSGNATSEPIALGNREAAQRLQGIADKFVFHNRDILVRCDDSVLRVRPENGAPLWYRRARGLTPSPVFLPGAGPCVFGVGPALKSTVCVTKADQAFVSQHIGDVENLETFAFYQEIAAHLQEILQVEPELVVRDLHPDYLSSQYATDWDKPVAAVQHHVAHIYSVLAENQCSVPALGLALDGTGLGEDGSIWGGEAFQVDPESACAHRLGHFAPVGLPGGEAAIKEPWRMARSYLAALGITAPSSLQWPWLERWSAADKVVAQMLEKKVNVLKTTSCGRLFDAVAGLLGLVERIDYEGQAAILLESIQDSSEVRGYTCPWFEQNGSILLNTLELFAAVYQDWLDGVAPGRISRRFHLGLSQGLAQWAAVLAERTGLGTVALSGGVFQNMTVQSLLVPLLQEQGLRPLVHTEVPPNDACISLGQAYYGQCLLRARGAAS
ncbi:MAG: carbamoyltransferase HypF [Thermodesulfobacteriota bacterium]